MPQQSRSPATTTLTINACDRAEVNATENITVNAYDTADVHATGHAVVNATGNTRVVLHDNLGGDGGVRSYCARHQAGTTSLSAPESNGDVSFMQIVAYFGVDHCLGIRWPAMSADLHLRYGFGTGFGTSLVHFNSSPYEDDYSPLWDDNEHKLKAKISSRSKLCPQLPQPTHERPSSR